VKARIHIYNYIFVDIYIYRKHGTHNPIKNGSIQLKQ
jgi:hypothetical protein